MIVKQTLERIGNLQNHSYFRDQKSFSVDFPYESIQKAKNINYENRSISLIIPAYNEEDRIETTIRDLLEVLDIEDQIIVVFDGNDRTPQIVKSFGDRVDLVISESRLGKGGAILRGFRHARNNIIGFVDADNAILASDVKRLASMVSEETPCVIGSRWLRSSKVLRQEPFFNVFAGRVFHYLAFFLLGISSKDTQCGIKFFTKDLVNQVYPRLTVKGRMFDVAVLYHVNLLKYKVTEVGITWTHRDGSRLPIMKAIPMMFGTILALKIIHSNRIKTDSKKIGEFAESLEHY